MILKKINHFSLQATAVDRCVHAKVFFLIRLKVITYSFSLLGSKETNSILLWFGSFSRIQILFICSWQMKLNSMLKYLDIKKRKTKFKMNQNWHLCQASETYKSRYFLLANNNVVTFCLKEHSWLFLCTWFWFINYLPDL